MKFWIFTRLICILAFFFILPVSKVRSQSYGLGFNGQEVVQDRRTGLEPGNGSPLCIQGDFTLSFDFAFLTNRADYFGYIVRIIDNEGNNIDLIYDRHDVSNKRFRLIKGDRFSSITFDLDTMQLYGSWTKLSFAFSADGKNLRFSYGENEFAEPVSMSGDGCFSVFFGRNDYDEFKTRDVPAMKVRNIKIFEGKKLAYHWPLDQVEGSNAGEAIKGQDASVVNPVWLRKKYMEWQLLHTQSMKGEASVAFDPGREQVYVVGADSLLRYTVPTGKTEIFGYLSGPLHLVNGSQSVYDTDNERLLNFCVDQRIVSGFDLQAGKWDRDFFSPAPGTHFLHLNKFYSPADSSVYFIGGYGHYLYKDSVFRYHVPSANWTFIRPGGEKFTPRYLAALGAVESGAYIVGGYGSASGQQMLNPKNLYDFLYFNKKKRTFEKKFRLNVKKEDFVFANSLVIDQAANSWYGLIFPKHKFRSSLQLIKGSLSDSVFSLAGNEIPYQFHDVHSFADLFYCAQSRRFLAVTIFRDGNGTATVKLYSLFSPPLPPAPSGFTAQAKPPVLLLLAFFLAGLGLLIVLYLVKKRRSSLAGNAAHGDGTFVPASDTSSAPPALLSDRRSPPAPALRKNGEKDISPVNSVFLFGDLQLFNREGSDVTAQFSPLLKELFLILLLHTLRNGKGISSAKLTELLWYDKSGESARNNRSVNIARLKTIIRGIGENSNICKDGGFWKLIMDKEVYIDYRDYLSIIHDRQQLNKQKLISLSEIVKRGNFLPQANHEWLDPFKSEISNEVIDTYVHFANTEAVNEDPEFLVNIATYISCFDPLNEEAMAIKCRALVRLGKHSLAAQAFEHFCKKYRQIYGEEFNADFKSVLH